MTSTTSAPHSQHASVEGARSFPPGFLWGSATSAHQVEGNNVASDWWYMEQRPDSALPEPSGDACDSYHRFAEDIDLLAGAGLDTYRFSVEWSRIEPAPGALSLAALAHYQRMVDACLAKGVRPIVTLHHFTNPLWFKADGGWRRADACDLFSRYVEFVVTRLSGVDRYCTINEPNVIATYSGMIDTGAGMNPRPDPELSAALLAAHRRAMQILRDKGAKGGLTLAMCAYTTDGSAGAEEVLARHREADEDQFIYGARDDDFLGVQVYSRRFVTPEGVQPHGNDFNGASARRTMSGWNYYPQALGQALRRAADLAPGLPLLVTENGISTDDDAERVDYTAEALGSLHAALADGIYVEGYLHWSLLDNFEWMEGFRPTFGLVAVDRQTFARTPKPSLDWLGRVAKANALPSA